MRWEVQGYHFRPVILDIGRQLLHEAARNGVLDVGSCVYCRLLTLGARRGACIAGSGFLELHHMSSPAPTRALSRSLAWGMLCCAGQHKAYTSSRPCIPRGQIHTVPSIQAASASPFQISSLAATRAGQHCGYGICTKVGMAGDCC